MALVVKGGLVAGCWMLDTGCRKINGGRYRVEGGSKKKFYRFIALF
jgi:hypothetical protein